MSSRKLLNESSGDKRGCEGTIEGSDWEESRGQDKKNGGKQEVGEENFEALEELGEGGNGWGVKRRCDIQYNWIFNAKMASIQSNENCSPSTRAPSWLLCAASLIYMHWSFSHQPRCEFLLSQDFMTSQIFKWLFSSWGTFLDIKLKNGKTIDNR